MSSRRPTKAFTRVFTRAFTRAFTLIELLLALTLAGVVIAVAGRTAVNAVTTERRISGVVAQSRRDAYLFRVIRDDLSARTEEDVEFAVDPNGRPTMTIACLASFSSDALHTPMLPSSVVYRLVRASDDGESLDLLRVVTDRTRSSAAPHTTVVADDIASMQYEVFDAGRWQELDAGTEARLREPEAVRIGIEYRENDHPQRRTFLLGSRTDDEP